MSDKVVSITGEKPPSDEERELVEFFAQRLRGYVEIYGHVPSTTVFVMYGNGNGGMDWATSFVASTPVSQVEATSTAAGLLLRDKLR